MNSSVILITVQFLLAIFLINLNKTLSVPIKKQIGNLIAQPKIRKFERDSLQEFEFVTMSTKVEVQFSELPIQSSFFWDMDSPDLLFGDACDVQLVVDLIDFQQVTQETSVTLCLFQGSITAIDNLFIPNQKLKILGNFYDPILYMKKLEPITGFVMGEFNSVIHGFLINESFYGTIRLFDSLPHHHIIFNIEPFRNLGLYNPELQNLKREPGQNAILFEYVRHEADMSYNSVTEGQNLRNTSVNSTIQKNSTNGAGNSAPVSQNSDPVAQNVVPVSQNLSLTTPQNLTNIGQNFTVNGSKNDDLFEKKTDENYQSILQDVSHRVKVKSGVTISNIFDMRKEDSTICEICVWVQPNFAEKYGLRGGVRYGVGEILNMLSFVQFIFQGIDFNGDQFADELNIVIKEFLVSDEINVTFDVKSNKNGLLHLGNTTNLVQQSTSATNQSSASSIPPLTSGRRKRAKSQRARRNRGVTSGSTKQIKDTDYEDFELEEPFSRETKRIDPKDAYEIVRKQLVKRFLRKKCCAIIAYIYHNMVPKLSYSTMGGICSRNHNVAVISGYIHGHKIGKFDIFRSTMHALGHLFGAKEDDISNPNCKLDMKDTPKIFNPTLMDSFHKIDIGIRPNSLRYSLCAKLDITSFLTSQNVHCLRSTKKLTAKCGNGIVEPGEQCDCGLLWQCHNDELEKPSCCGESDTFVGCTKIGALRYRMDAHCHRPFIW